MPRFTLTTSPKSSIEGTGCPDGVGPVVEGAGTPGGVVPLKMKEGQDNGDGQGVGEELPELELHNPSQLPVEVPAPSSGCRRSGRVIKAPERLDL